MKTIYSSQTWQCFQLQTFWLMKRAFLVFFIYFFMFLCPPISHPDYLWFLWDPAKRRKSSTDPEIFTWLALSLPVIGSLRVWGIFSLTLPKCSHIISSEISFCRYLIEVASLIKSKFSFSRCMCCISTFVLCCDRSRLGRSMIFTRTE